MSMDFDVRGQQGDSLEEVLSSACTFSANFHFRANYSLQH